MESGVGMGVEEVGVAKRKTQETFAETNTAYLSGVHTVWDNHRRASVLNGLHFEVSYARAVISFGFPSS